ncbi:MAG TPA: nucleotide exchange factor GrpE [Sedimentisphaerales bacterium]|nr:nucleotide exchange factor GrpE [Sedimentisphaerales bacterium]
MKQNKSETPREQKKPALKKSELQELRQQIDELQREKDELFAKLQRVSADYDNLQKRTSKQIADTIGYEKEKIIKTLLPVLDNFEHSLQNAHQAENVDVLLKGIQIIYDQMLDILKSHNVEQIKALGEPFDPALHEAMMQKTEPEQQENIVLEEFQKGYKLNGRVIRPSKVIVNKLTPKQPARQKAESPDQSTDELGEQ